MIQYALRWENFDSSMLDSAYDDAGGPFSPGVTVTPFHCLDPFFAPVAGAYANRFTPDEFCDAYVISPVEACEDDLCAYHASTTDSMTSTWNGPFRWWAISLNATNTGPEWGFVVPFCCSHCEQWARSACTFPPDFADRALSPSDFGCANNIGGPGFCADHHCLNASHFVGPAPRIWRPITGIQAASNGPFPDMVLVRLFSMHRLHYIPESPDPPSFPVLLQAEASQQNPGEQDCTSQIPNRSA